MPDVPHRKKLPLTRRAKNRRERGGRLRHLPHAEAAGGRYRAFRIDQSPHHAAAGPASAGIASTSRLIFLGSSLIGSGVQSQRGGRRWTVLKESGPFRIGIRVAGLLIVVSTVAWFWNPSYRRTVHQVQLARGPDIGSRWRGVLATRLWLSKTRIRKRLPLRAKPPTR